MPSVACRQRGQASTLRLTLEQFDGSQGVSGTPSATDTLEPLSPMTVQHSQS